MSLLKGFLKIFDLNISDNYNNYNTLESIEKRKLRNEHRGRM